MAITTYDGLIASAKQDIPFNKTVSRTAVIGIRWSVFDIAGNPGAGTLAGTSTTAGVVPTDATAGCPVINAFGGGAKGYLGSVAYGSTVASRLFVSDMLWKGGAYPFNAAVTLSAQPSYSSRVPGGTDFTGLEIWIEAITAFTGNLSIAVTYTNQSGTTGRTTGTIATGAALGIGRMVQLPLQAGDTGVQKIESVTGTVATVGTFNVLVLRNLWSGRVGIVNAGGFDGPDKTLMPEVFADSALILTVAADGTATGGPETYLTIVNG